MNYKKYLVACLALLIQANAHALDNPLFVASVIVPLIIDSDDDGLPDYWERRYGFNPKAAGEESLDGDNDGLNNLGEFRNGTDPGEADIDEDGLPDGQEVDYGSSPLIDDRLKDVLGTKGYDGCTNQGFSGAALTHDDRFLYKACGRYLRYADTEITNGITGSWKTAFDAGTTNNWFNVLTISSNDQYLYARGENSLIVFRRNIVTGAVEELQRYQNGMDGLQGVALNLAGNSRRLQINNSNTRLYVPTTTGVLVVALDPASGLLTRVIGVAGSEDVRSEGIYIDQSGDYLYVPEGDALKEYRIESTGVTEQNSVMLEGVRDVLLSPDDAHLYAAGIRGISVFDRDSGGLTGVVAKQLQEPSTSSSERAVYALAQSPDGSQIYAFTQRSTYTGTNRTDRQWMLQRHHETGLLYRWKAFNSRAIFLHDVQVSREGDRIYLIRSNDYNYFTRDAVAGRSGDFDGDGVANGDDAFPLDANEHQDTDGDGFGDNSDAFIDDAAEWLDSDGDGIGNNADPDSDNDGMPDVYEIAVGLDPTVNDAAGDLDNDGLTNLQDYQNGTSASVADTDQDGTPDNQETGGGDADGDSIPDAWEQENNTDPYFSNAAADYDNDALNNLGEYQQQSDPRDPDTDEDGLPDGQEVDYGSSPLIDDRLKDVLGTKGYDGCTNQGFSGAALTHDDRFLYKACGRYLRYADTEITNGITGSWKTAFDAGTTNNWFNVLTISSNDQYLYARGENSLIVFRRNIVTGAVEELQRYQNGMDGLQGVALNLAGNSRRLQINNSNTRLYVPTTTGVLVVALDPASGLLTRVIGVAGSEDVRSEGIYIDQSGDYLYVPEGDALKEYRIESTGVTEQNSVMLEGVRDVLLSPDDAHLYAAGIRGISVFDRDSGGLTGVVAKQLQEPSTSSSERAVYALAQSPDGSQIYAFTQRSTYTGTNRTDRQWMLQRHHETGLLYRWKAFNSRAIFLHDVQVSREGDRIYLIRSNDYNYFTRDAVAGRSGDFDGDGVANGDDAFPLDANEHQDTDGDGFGDNSDAFIDDAAEWLDSDGDGIGNNADPDSDNDGMPDVYEIAVGLDPTVNDAAGDLDNDGLTNLQDYQNGTSASVADTDQDGTPDNQETGGGDADGDSIPDAWEQENNTDPYFSNAAADYDNDALNNLGEYQQQSDPRDPDTDEDGLPDGQEVDYGSSPLIDDRLKDVLGTKGYDGCTNQGFSGAALTHDDRFLYKACGRYLRYADTEITNGITGSWKTAFDAGTTNNWFNVLTISSNDQYLYARGENSLIVFRRNIVTGAVEELQRYQNGMDGLQGVALNLAGNSRRLQINNSNTRLYVPTTTGVLVVALDPASGLLTRVIGVAGSEDVRSEGIYIDQSGDYLYVPEGDALKEYRIESTGVTEQNSVMLEGVRDVLLSPDDAHLYAAGIRGISVFDRDSGGLTGVVAKQLQEPSTSSSERAVYALAQSPDGSQIYAFTQRSTYTGTNRTDRQWMLQRHHETGLLYRWRAFNSGVVYLHDVQVSREGDRIYLIRSNDYNYFTRDAVAARPEDMDRDGIPDEEDEDIDGDGVLNEDDAFPRDASETSDRDGDGIGDVADTDDDNDGMPDVWETEHGLNPHDATDATKHFDNDGLNNLGEYEHGTEPRNPDTDSDGIVDGAEVTHGLEPLTPTPDFSLVDTLTLPGTNDSFSSRQALAVSPDDHHVYGITRSGLRAWSRQADGRLQEIQHIAAEGYTNLVISDDGQWVYVSKIGVLLAYQRNVHDGTLTEVVSLPSATAFNLVVSDDGQDVYVRGIKSNPNAVYHFRWNSGRLENKGVAYNGTGYQNSGMLMKVAGTNRYYMVYGHFIYIQPLTRDETTGKLTRAASPFNTRSTADIYSLLVNADHTHAYANFGNRIISYVLDNDAGTFADSALPASGNVSGVSAALSPGNKWYYTGDSNANELFGLRISENNKGALLQSRTLDGVTAPRSVAVSHDGQYVYVGGHDLYVVRHPVNYVRDTDGDGIADTLDNDIDGDGVNNADDAFPFNPDESIDNDRDGVGANSDVDDNNDEEWRDFDGDSIGDVADTDDDNDGMPDVWETEHGLNPYDSSDAATHADNDLLNNLNEYQNGTDPNNPDTDNDNILDGPEVDNALDPLTPTADFTLVETVNIEGAFTGLYSSLAVSPDDRHLYGATSTGMMVWSRQADGRLQDIQHINAENYKLVVISQDGLWVYVSQQKNLIVYQRNTHTGQLTETEVIEVPVDTNQEISDLMVSNDGRDVYVRSYRKIHQYSWNKGQLEIGESVQPVSGSGHMIMSASGDRVYVADHNYIRVYYRNGETGDLTHQQRFFINAGFTFARTLSLSQEGDYLLVQISNGGVRSIPVQDNGLLVSTGFKTLSTNNTGVHALLSPGGDWYYANKYSDGRLAGYRVSESDSGVLLPSRTIQRLREPRSIAVSHDGQYVYVGGHDLYVVRHPVNYVRDTDGDGIADTLDNDIDGDGVNNADDAFPFNPDESIDNDRDGVGANSDVDDNNDEEWRDFDGDSIGDVADTDDDNDGMPDVWETEHGLNPYDSSDAATHADNDLLNNLNEYQNGTDPNNPDTDNDNILDGPEVDNALDPLTPTADFTLVETVNIEGAFTGLYSSLAVSPDDRHLYGATSTGMMVWSRQADGRLQDIQHINAENYKLVVISQDGLWVYVSQQKNLIVYQRNTHTGQLTETEVIEVPVDTNQEISDLMVSNDGRDVYVRSYRKIHQYSWNKGQLEIGESVQPVSGSGHMIMSASGDRVYVADHNYIRVYYRNGETGDLTHQQRFFINAGFTFARTLSLSQEGDYLLVQISNGGVRSIPVQDNGLLVSTGFKTLSTNNTGVHALLSPGGDWYYANKYSDGRLAGYRVSESDSGVLLPSRTIQRLREPRSIAVSHDGQYVYVGGHDLYVVRHPVNYVRDTDGDGIADTLDNDIDGDGVNNADDAFPFNPDESIDNDRDGVGANLDVDDNNDEEWRDFDGDGIGDVADTDDDNDGMPDVWETEHGLNPYDSSDAATHADNDLLNNLNEYQNGTDPNNPDTDNDNILDGPEVDNALDPLTPTADFTLVETVNIEGAFTGLYSSLAVSPDDRHLYGATSTGMMVWSRQADGRLQDIQHINAENYKLVVISQDGLWVYVSQQKNLIVYQRNTHTGQLTETEVIEVPVDTNQEISDLMVSNDGRDVYVRSYRKIHQYSWNKGQLEIGESVQPVSGSGHMIMSASGDRVYVADHNYIRVYYRNGETGDLTHQQRFFINAGFTFARTLSLSQEGDYLLVQISNGGVRSIPVQDNGLLVSTGFKTLSTNNTGVHALLSPGGDWYYANKYSDGRLAGYRVSESDSGVLLPSRTIQRLREPRSIAVSHDGQYVYVGGHDLYVVHHPVTLAEPDLDGDGVPDSSDDDIDGDGYSNEDEINRGSDPRDPDSVPAVILPTLQLFTASQTVTTNLFTISGQVTAGDYPVSLVSLITDTQGAPDAERPVSFDSSGRFSVSVGLTEGENRFAIRVRDARNNTPDDATLVLTYNAPQFDVVSVTPASGTGSENKEVAVSVVVSASDNRSQVRFGNVTLTLQDGSAGLGDNQYRYAGTLTLNPGDNEFILQVAADGRSLQQEINYRYQPTDLTEYPAPVVSLRSPAETSRTAADEIALLGTVDSPVGGITATINGHDLVVRETSDNAYSIAGELSLTEGENQYTLQVEDALNQTSQVTFAVEQDRTAPELIITNGFGEALNELLSPRVVIEGSSSSEDLAYISVNGTNVSLERSANGSYTFAYPVTLPVQQQMNLEVIAADDLGNNTTQTYPLIATNNLTMEWITPVLPAQWIIERGTAYPFAVKLDGASGAESYEIYFTRQDENTGENVKTPVTHTKTGQLLAGTLPLLAEKGEYTLVVEAHLNSEDSITLEGRVSVISQDDIPLEIADVVPANDSSDSEPDTFISVTFNRPVDPAGISITAKRSLIGKTYQAQDAAGTNFLHARGQQLVDVQINRENVSGGVSVLPDDSGYVFYPDQDFGYGADVEWEISYQGEILTRQQFRTRSLPTLIEGGVHDTYAQIVPGVEVTIKELGLTTVTNNDGAFSFGYQASAADNIPGGSYTLVINPERRYGGLGEIEIPLTVREGRRNSLLPVRVPNVAREIPWTAAGINVQEVRLAEGDLTLNLEGAELEFPDENRAMHVQFIPANNTARQLYPGVAAFWFYQIQPFGISVSSGINIRMNTPRLYGETDYMILNEGESRYSFLLGYNNERDVIEPIGVVRITENEIRTVKPVNPDTLDYIGVAYSAPDEEQQKLFRRYINEEITFLELVSRVVVQ